MEFMQPKPVKKGFDSTSCNLIRKLPKPEWLRHIPMLAVVEHASINATRLKITDSIAADRMTITSASSGKHQVISAAMKATSSLHVILAGAGDHHHHQQR